ncbi:MAG: TMEM175 family protein [bacterium]
MSEGLRGRTLGPERFKALADGVFSIALTLLIIDVVAAAKHVEHGASLSGHLMNHWGTGAAYLVGFLTIFVCWVNHQAVLDEVVRVDREFLWVGGLQLGLVSAVPLPTALLADHFIGADRHTAFFLYGVTFMLMAASFWALSRTVLRRGLADDEGARGALAKLNRAYLIAMVWTVLCLLVLRFNLFAALAMWAAMFYVFAFPAEFAGFVHARFGGRTRNPA